MNNELIGRYLEELEKENLSENTIVSYKNDMETLNIFLGNFSIINFDKTKLIEYINFLRDNFTNNTVIKKLNSFKSFYKTLVNQKIVSGSLLDDLKNFKMILVSQRYCQKKS